MVTKSKPKGTKKKSSKGRVKVLKLKPDTIKDLSGKERKNVKGGGGMLSGVVMSRKITDM